MKKTEKNPDTEQLRAVADKLADQYQKEFEEISDYIFKNPELGLAETKSAAYLVKKLKEYGFEVREKYCGFPTAFRAELGDGAGPVVCFLPEYDALPGYGKKKDQNAHACGHNWIAGCTLGAAVVLSKMKHLFKGKIVVIGTPAEETLGAKVNMVNDGAFKDIDVVFQMHLGDKTNTATKALAIDSLKFEFFGKTAHASSFPEEGINALDSVNLMYAGINALRQHVKSDVRIHGVIRNGGLAPNIVPDYAACEFMIRSETREYLDTVTQKVINCAKGAALMTGCKLKYAPADNPFDNLLNLPLLQDLMEKNLAKAGVENILRGVPGGAGSSDIGNVSKVVPTMYAELGVKTKENCYVHNEAFLQYVNCEQSNRLLNQAVKAMANCALELYGDKKLLTAVQKEFATLSGK
ncbi:MAG: M20 family metallopeptidase [Fusobacteriaceae bacterium]|jgi:amidohydrolase|nr:M20 family metallopeptidase [Fusobacteriaceae bacterium]